MRDVIWWLKEFATRTGHQNPGCFKGQFLHGQRFKMPVADLTSLVKVHSIYTDVDGFAYKVCSLTKEAWNQIAASKGMS